MSRKSSQQQDQSMVKCTPSICPSSSSLLLGNCRQGNQGIEHDDNDLAVPIAWDTAHLLNLAVTGVQEAQTETGSHFRLFVKRCNVFNHI